jgi:hypothetical protein
VRSAVSMMITLAARRARTCGAGAPNAVHYTA